MYSFVPLELATLLPGVTAVSSAVTGMLVFVLFLVGVLVLPKRRSTVPNHAVLLLELFCDIGVSVCARLGVYTSGRYVVAIMITLSVLLMLGTCMAVLPVVSSAYLGFVQEGERGESVAVSHEVGEAQEISTSALAYMQQNPLFESGTLYADESLSILPVVGQYATNPSVVFGLLVAALLVLECCTVMRVGVQRRVRMLLHARGVLAACRMVRSVSGMRVRTRAGVWVWGVLASGVFLGLLAAVLGVVEFAQMLLLGVGVATLVPLCVLLYAVLVLSDPVSE